MRGISIRLRVTVWYSAVLLAGLAAFGAGMWFALEQRLMGGADAALAARVEGLKTTLELEGGQPWEQLRLELSEFAREVPEGALMQLTETGGAVLLPFPDPAGAPRFAGVTSGYQTKVQGGHSFRVLAARFEFHGRKYDAVVATDLQGMRAVLRDFRRILLFLIPAVLGIAACGGYWISGRALAPMDEITRVAKSISVQNLSQRLAVPRTNDEIQRMSEAWNDVLERLESAVKRIRQFTADASHELRTPVALIRASAELALRRERSVDEYRESLRQIHAESERMTELTESLLELARADAQGEAIPLSATDVGRVVAEVARQTTAAALEKGIRLETQTRGGRLLALANESALRRLLLILLDNALKHTPPEGRVTMSVAESSAGVTVAVEDTGQGIPSEALQHVFERFYRADPARSGGSGAGLGLSIAQSIAQAHHAVIRAESAPGSGARFEFVLPVPG